MLLRVLSVVCLNVVVHCEYRGSKGIFVLIAVVFIIYGSVVVILVVLIFLLFTSVVMRESTTVSFRVVAAHVAGDGI